MSDAATRSHHAPNPRPIRSADVQRLARVTYRQLDYWTRQGWLRPEGDGGSGFSRSWPLPEVAIACRMGALVEVGLHPAYAAQLARNGWTS